MHCRGRYAVAYHLQGLPVASIMKRLPHNLVNLVGVGSHCTLRGQHCVPLPRSRALRRVSHQKFTLYAVKKGLQVTTAVVMWKLSAW
jgi:hypothetical protein|mmetsp:Transcript_17834/g.29274  ORF Transcript_17834/g.29274 Transcript_17834/m.29274 type:complete len:87 (+) Transcript_17834:2535-2795(+)